MVEKYSLCSCCASDTPSDVKTSVLINATLQIMLIYCFYLIYTEQRNEKELPEGKNSISMLE